MGLTEFDSKHFARLIKYRKETLLQGDNTISTTPKSTENYIDEYGENVRRKIHQPQKRLSEADISAIIREYKSGVNTYILATKYGCHRTTISNCLKKKNGINVTIEKLTEESIVEVVALYESGLNTTQIAERFECSYPTILRHLRNNGVKMRTRWDY